jgi:small subunit ribosomal protein S6e
MGQDVDASTLGDEWKGYTLLRVTGGNDKQGFTITREVLTLGCVCLLVSKNYSCNLQRRAGENERKSFRGCVVNKNLYVISMAIVKKRDQEIPGLTDKTVHHRLGPKRASKIMKLFDLSKEDNVTQYVIKKPLQRGRERSRRNPSSRTP